MPTSLLIRPMIGRTEATVLGGMGVANTVAILAANVDAISLAWGTFAVTILAAIGTTMSGIIKSYAEARKAGVSDELIIAKAELRASAKAYADLERRLDAVVVAHDTEIKDLILRRDREIEQIRNDYSYLLRRVDDGDDKHS